MGTKNNKKLSITLAAIVFALVILMSFIPVGASDDGNDASVTFGETTTEYATFEEAWNTAAGYTTAEANRATVKLLDNITAGGPTHSFGTGVGFGDGTSAGTGCILVPTGKYISLDLNGKTIDRAVGATSIEAGYVINVSGNLVLNDLSVNADGTITGGNEDGNGGGVNIAENGVFTMIGGTISGNRGGFGGGVKGGTNTLFTMTGGTISGNRGEYGGGVTIGGAFLMTGGTISGNTATLGGGVYISDNRSFTMTGGTISGNNISVSGGCVQFGTNGKFFLSGTAVITGNFQGGTKNETSGLYEIGAGSLANVYFLSGQKINISDNNALTSGDSFTGNIGIKLETAPTDGSPVTVTSGWKSSTGKIYSDNSEYAVLTKSSEKAVGLAVASVTFDINNDGDTADIGETTNYATFAEAWNTAAGYTTAEGNRATVKPFDNVTASSVTQSFGTGVGFGFGTNATGSGCILVPTGKYITLDLNGKTIDRAAGETGISGGSVIIVNGNLLLTDSAANGTITGGNANGYGGGVFIESTGTFTMTGGTISGNYTRNDGGGVCAKGQFTMTGGAIIGNNTGIDGGGVYAKNKFIMTGGTISGNNSAAGGSGVDVDSSGTFTMTGGTITGNNTINGSGSVEFYTNGSFYLSGAAVITGNFKGGTKNETSGLYEIGAGSLANVYLSSGATIKISDNDVSTSGDSFTGNVGVKTFKTPSTSTPIIVTKSWGSSSGNVFADNPLYLISMKGSEKAVFMAVASVTFDSNNDGDTADVGETTEYATFGEAWNTAVGYTTSEGGRATVKLLENVKANSTTHSFGTGVGFGDGTSAGTGYILVPTGKYITLDLNGKTIDRVMGETRIANGNVIEVIGNLLLTDTATGGKITGGYSSGNGGGIGVGGTFTMSGGTISENKTNYGGGVYVYNSGTFVLTAGTVSGNSTSNGNGGGVCVSDGGTFTMSGGTISGNSVNNGYGGGVYISSSGTFTMSDGTISGNHTNMYGGGVHDDGLFTMTGGTISGNDSDRNGGGVRVDYGEFNLSGTANITGNTTEGTQNATSGLYEVGANGSSNNVYLCQKKFNISDNDPSTSDDSFTGNVGVTLGDPPTISVPVIVTSGWGSSTGTITSDKSCYYPRLFGGEIRLFVESYTLKFDANGGSATENMTVFYGNTYILPNPTRSGYIFNGWYKSETADNGSGDQFNPSTIPDFGDNGTEVLLYAKWTEKTAVAVPTDAGSAAYTGAVLTSGLSAPSEYTITANLGGTDVGQYDVELTLTDNANYKWATGPDTATRIVKFSITKATNSFSTGVSIIGWTYGETANAPGSTAKFGTPSYTYCDSESGTYTSTVPTTAGTHWVKATVIGTDNYTAVESKAPFIISKATPTTSAQVITATYGQTLSQATGFAMGYALEQDGSGSVGTVASPTSGLTAIFTPADTANYNLVTGITVTLTVNKATPTTSAQVITAKYGETLSQATGLATGYTLDQDGSGTVGTVASPTSGLTATFTPADTANYNIVTGIAVTLTVNKATPTTLAQSITAVYGQTLSQATGLATGYTLDQTGSGTVGTVASPTSGLTATFTSTDNYTVVTGIAVTLTVNKATPITSPQAITATYGQTLSQATGLATGYTLDQAGSGTVGTVASPTSGLTATFTPTDTANYNIVTGVAVTLTVNKATPTTLAQSITAVYGQTLSQATGLATGYTLDQAGSGTVGTVASPTSGLTATFTPADTANYSVATGVAVTLTVNKATPTTSAQAITAIYGQTLSQAIGLGAGYVLDQDGSGSVGTVASPTSGLTATFTPTDTANYNIVTGVAVTLTVNKATPTTSTQAITATYGQTLSQATGLATGYTLDQAGSGTVGTVASPTSGLTATFIPDDRDNYNEVTGIDVTLTVNKATPTTSTQAITATYGQTLSQATGLATGYTLNQAGSVTVGTVSVPIMGLTATFNPADTANYNVVKGVPVALTVKAQKVTGPSQNSDTFTYSGIEQVYTLATDSRYSITNDKRTDAGSQTVNVALNDKANYEWATGGTEDISFAFTISQAQAVITVDQTAIVKEFGESWTLPAATSNFGTVSCDKTVDDLINVNSYVLTYSVPATDNYLGDSKTVNVTVNTQKVTKPGADASIFIADGTDKTYAIAADSRYTVSGNVESEVGIYTVTVALNDKENNEWSDGTTENITFDFVIRQPQLSEKADETAEKDEVVATIKDGFAPNVTVSIVLVEQTLATDVSGLLDNDEEVAVVYDVKLLIGGVETQPNGILTIKILIPEQCEGKHFRILHVHGDETTEMPYTIEGDYAVVTTDRLSEFVFVAPKDVISLIWLIILLAILIAVESILAVRKMRKDAKDKDSVKLRSFMPILLGVLVPMGQIIAVIVLGVIAIIGAMFDIYLYFIKDKSK